MWTKYLWILFLSLALACSDTGFEEPLEEKETIIGSWRHIQPAFVHIGPNESKEMGTHHFIVSFSAQGDFSYKNLALGIYLDSQPTDTVAFRDDLGIYTLDGDSIHIDLHSRVLWDSFFGQDTQPDTTANNYDNLFMNASYFIEQDTLHFSYYHSQRHLPEFFEEQFAKLD